MPAYELALPPLDRRSLLGGILGGEAQRPVVTERQVSNPPSSWSRSVQRLPGGGPPLRGGIEGGGKGLAAISGHPQADASNRARPGALPAPFGDLSVHWPFKTQFTMGPRPPHHNPNVQWVSSQTAPTRNGGRSVSIRRSSRANLAIRTTVRTGTSQVRTTAPTVVAGTGITSKRTRQGQPLADVQLDLLGGAPVPVSTRRPRAKPAPAFRHVPQSLEWLKHVESVRQATATTGATASACPTVSGHHAKRQQEGLLDRLVSMKLEKRSPDGMHRLHGTIEPTSGSHASVREEGATQLDVLSNATGQGRSTDGATAPTRPALASSAVAANTTT